MTFGPLAARPAALGGLAMLLVLTQACRFERRPDLGAASDPEVVDTADLAEPGDAVQDSLRAVVAAYHEALRVGDASRVASLSAPGAVIVDQEEGVEWRRGEGGTERLPVALGATPSGLGWNRAGSEVHVFQETALLVDWYRVTVSGEEVPWDAVESFVLVRTPDGWRIRYAHRSRGPGDLPPLGPGRREDAP